MKFPEFIFALQDVIKIDDTRQASREFLNLLKREGWSTSRDIPEERYEEVLSLLEQAPYADQAVS